MSKFEKEALYYVKFLDHSFGIDKGIMCEVCGWVTKESEECLTLTVWHVDDKCKAVRDANTEPVTIVKSCIRKKRKIII